MSENKPKESEKEPAEEDEEEVPVEKLDSWQLYVHVQGKTFAVSCGAATQRVKWLAHVGIGKIDYSLVFNSSYKLNFHSTMG